jgi:hypothetical protein
MDGFKILGLRERIEKTFTIKDIKQYLFKNGALYSNNYEEDITMFERIITNKILSNKIWEEDDINIRHLVHTLEDQIYDKRRKVEKLLNELNKLEDQQRQIDELL